MSFGILKVYMEKSVWWCINSDVLFQQCCFTAGIFNAPPRVPNPLNRYEWSGQSLLKGWAFLVTVRNNGKFSLPCILLNFFSRERLNELNAASYRSPLQLFQSGVCHSPAPIRYSKPLVQRQTATERSVSHHGASLRCQRGIGVTSPGTMQPKAG